MKRRIIILEIRSKECGKMMQINEEFINKIKILPLYGGGLNPNMNYEIGIEFPEEIDLIGRKIKVAEFDESSFKIIEELR